MHNLKLHLRSSHNDPFLRIHLVRSLVWVIQPQRIVRGPFVIEKHVLWPH
jgi:hypothetical protein